MKWVCAVVLLLFGCNNNDSSQSSSIVFTEVITEISPTVCGADDPTQILEVNGTGLALFDYDRDGDLDLFVVNAASLDNFASGPGCRLYENQSDELSIVFIDVTERAQISVFRWANGVAVGDANGDGYDDLYITCHGPNILLLNNGDGTFSDATVFAGVGDDRWGTSATFGDLDGDGVDDIVVGAPREDRVGEDSGSVYFFSSASGAQLMRIDGAGANHFFGHSLAGLADINGDGATGCSASCIDSLLFSPDYPLLSIILTSLEIGTVNYCLYKIGRAHV